MQLFDAWICVCIGQFGGLWIFHLARLLLLFNENIKAFLQILRFLNIFHGRQLITKFQFLIVVFVTFCCSDKSSVYCAFNFCHQCYDIILNFIAKCIFCNFCIFWTPYSTDISVFYIRIQNIYRSSRFTYFPKWPLLSLIVRSISPYIVLKSCRSHAKYSSIRG